MLQFKFKLKNPLKKYFEFYDETLFSCDTKIYKTKNLDTQLDVGIIDNLIEFELDTSFRGRDHAGPLFSFTFLCLSFYIQLYDSRHWDYENDTWESYE